MAKQRLDVLDGMRGIAALAVAAYHTGLEFETPSYLTVHGNIGVDFFFALSGFVIAYSFEDRLSTKAMSKIDFVKNRIARLWPMVIFGTALSVLIMSFIHIEEHDLGTFPLLTIFLAFFSLPGPSGGWITWDVNGVYWSLIAEILINLVYLLFFKFRTSTLVVLNLLGFCFLTYYAFEYNTIQLLPRDFADLPGTFFRVFVPFSAGVIIFRLREHFGALAHVNPLVPIALLVIPFMIPGSNTIVRVVIPLFFVLIVFPLVIWLGADAKDNYSKIFKFLGNASYPLYVIHLPMAIALAIVIPGQSLIVRLAICAIFPLCALVVGWLLNEYYDNPMRKFLAKAMGLRR